MELLAQEGDFGQFAQLWKECCSTEEPLPFPNTPDSQFSIVRTLMNMMAVSLNKIELQASSVSNESPCRRTCRKCIQLRSDLLKANEEYNNLSEQLERSREKEMEQKSGDNQQSHLKTPVKENPNELMSSPPFSFSPIIQQQPCQPFISGGDTQYKDFIPTSLVITSTQNPNPRQPFTPIKNKNSRISERLINSPPFSITQSQILFKEPEVEEQHENSPLHHTTSIFENSCVFDDDLIPEPIAMPLPRTDLHKENEETPMEIDKPGSDSLNSGKRDGVGIPVFALSDAEAFKEIPKEIPKTSSKDTDGWIDSDNKSKFRESRKHKKSSHNTSSASAAKSKAIRLSSWNPSVEQQQPSYSRSKNFKQTTLPRSFSNAKARSRTPIQTIDLSSMKCFDDGWRDGVSREGAEVPETEEVKRRQDANMRKSPLKATGLCLPPSAESKSKKDQEDPDETAFTLTLQPRHDVIPSTSTNTRSIKKREIGNATLELIKTYNDIPNPNKDSGRREFAYKPEKAIRKKEERARLPGWDCDQCRNYYAALESQLPPEEIQKIKDKCSKHRSKYQANPSGTPPHFWDVDFPSTAECIERGYLGEGVLTPFPSPSR